MADRSVLKQPSRYRPSIVLAILGTVLFTIATTVHLWLLVKHRLWWFTPLVVGTSMEIVGYVFRLLSSQKDPYSVPYFVVQYFFIVVAPVTFSAAIYLIVSAMIKIYGREYAPLPPKVILSVFIACDVIATTVQVTGSALVGVAYSNHKDPTTYNYILVGGLAFQVFAFAIFLVLLFWMLFKARRSTETINKNFILATIIATVAVYLRTCFRLVESSEGLEKKLSSHEVYFGCLEFAPIVVAVYILVIWHPGHYLKSAALARPKREGTY